jgi:hypothetical protein
VYAAAALLLLVAGAAKVRSPDSTAKALRQAGWRWAGSPTVVRFGAGAEVAVAVAALAGTVVGARLMALSYLGFAAFVAVALYRGSPVSTCGCFGQPDARPTAAHLVVDLGAAASLAGRHAPPMDGQPLAGLPLAVLVGVAAYLAFLVLSVLPRLRGAASP